jgi:hypothetical protein
MTGVPGWLRSPLDRCAGQDRVREDEVVVALVGLGTFEAMAGADLDFRLVGQKRDALDINAGIMERPRSSRSIGSPPPFLQLPTQGAGTGRL